MSQENFESFRRSLDAFNRGDVEAWLATIHPDVTFAPIRASVEGAYRGHAGVRRFFAENRETFESFHLNYADIRDLGDGRLLVIGTLHLRARGSGIETDVPTAAIATERDGLLIDWRDYGDSKKALEAAGLEEYAMSQENVEVAGRYLEATEEGIRGVEAIEALVNEYWESDGDYYPIRGFPEARPCHGREDIVRFFTAFYPAWEDYRYVIEDVRAVGDDRVLVHGAIRAEGRASGVALEGDAYHCFWVRHGRFIRAEDHLTLKGALHAFGLSGDSLEAAGLSEQEAYP